MQGRVTADGKEAVLSLDVIPPTDHQRIRRIDAVVDTGFTGHLTLPSEIVEGLSLPVIGSAESVLADGSVVAEDVCMARVTWHGKERAIRVLIADAVPLLGMALLQGSELRLTAKAGGEVTVEELL